MANISTIGLSTQSILQIRDAQATLGDLSNQLASGKKSLNLADYTLPEAKRILDFRGSVHKKNSYLDVINTIAPRLDLYEKSLDRLEKIGNDAFGLVNTTQNTTVAAANTLGEQFRSLLDNIGYHLNQKLGDRYLFSGTRYGTAPVQDLMALPVPPTSGDTVAVTSPTLPTYDTGAPGSSAASYAEDTAVIDDGYTVTYGVTSNDAGIQKLVLGLRWAYAATQDTTNFTTYMATARTLLSGALPDMRDTHGAVVANINRIDEIKASHNTLINSLTAEVDDIQRADSAEVAAKITFTQSRLEASYSVTAKIAQLSITKYI